MRRRRLITVSTVVFAFILVTTEMYLRYAGFNSYPIYDIDDDIKYIPSANQQGRFLKRNAWYFNDRNMGNIYNWTAEKHPNLLLIGNSIVLGGNPFHHPDKLGPLLEKDLGGRYIVWSAAAGGWTNVNEMAYLDRNADVLKNADAVVVEYMEGGLSAANAWPGYYVFPDRKPWILAEYIFRRYVLPRLTKAASLDFGSLPRTGASDRAQWQRFEALATNIAKQHKLVIFFYPALDNLKNRSAWQAEIAPIEELCRTISAKCLDIAQAPAWNEKFYSSDGVHPTVEGNKTLASILANAVN